MKPSSSEPLATLTDGSTDPKPSVTWTAMGGSITSRRPLYGAFDGGVFTVIGTTPDGPADTSTVTVHGSQGPTVIDLSVSPGQASLEIGATKQFGADATLSDGSTDPSAERDLERDGRYHHRGRPLQGPPG